MKDDKEAIERWKNDLRGCTLPSDNCRYQSKINGLYYNGFIHSPEGAEEMFGPMFREIADLILKDLEKLK